ncbi:MAG: hypothetical protein PHC70_02175 [Patescibacteria group bacterium]|nr:hypothetical protein [Patescibacteria group bacterium]
MIIVADKVKEKLRNVCDGCKDCVRSAFTQLLAERIPSILTPEAFVTSALFLIHELARGTLEKSEQSVALSGMPPWAYEVLIGELAEIADQVLPEDFAKLTKARLAAVQQSADEARITINISPPN